MHKILHVKREMQKGKRVSETVTDEVAASCAMCSLKQMDYTALPTGNMQIKSGRCLLPDVYMEGPAAG